MPKLAQVRLERRFVKRHHASILSSANGAISLGSAQRAF
jgi:hypothetical protein